MEIRTEWTVVKSYYRKGRLVHRDIYAQEKTIRECTIKIKNYKHILMKHEEPFFKDVKTIRGIYVRHGLDVRGGDKLIEFRIHPVNVFTKIFY